MTRFMMPDDFGMTLLIERAGAFRISFSAPFILATTA